MRDNGMFISFEVYDMGLVIQWDKGNSIYIRLKPKWRGRVQGLCGNFNFDGSDDFKTPSGLIEGSSEIFGDAWKLHKYCPKANNIQVYVMYVSSGKFLIVLLKDTCSLHPHRKLWSTKKCGILKSEVFRLCRSEVPLQPYFDQCVFDTCGCNVGGDCECLCTAVSAYAQACSEAGVPVKWRTQGVCGKLPQDIMFSSNGFCLQQCSVTRGPVINPAPQPALSRHVTIWQCTRRRPSNATKSPVMKAVLLSPAQMAMFMKMRKIRNVFDPLIASLSV